MYCVRCGVKLQSGETKCPLCNTVVIDPDDEKKVKEENYPAVFPKRQKTSNIPLAIMFTVFAIIAVSIILIVCNKVYGELRWGGIATLGVALAYIIAILPMWFERPNPVIFVPVDHAATALYLLFICETTGGNWFLSFAFPTVSIFGLLITAAIALFRYVKKGKYYILGGYSILLAAYSVLVELFLHITFGTVMFLWSFYTFTVFFGLGIFLILVGIIKPLREYLEKVFFT